MKAGTAYGPMAALTCGSAARFFLVQDVSSSSESTVSAVALGCVLSQNPPSLMELSQLLLDQRRRHVLQRIELHRLTSSELRDMAAGGLAGEQSPENGC